MKTFNAVLLGIGLLSGFLLSSVNNWAAHNRLKKQAEDARARFEEAREAQNEAALEMQRSREQAEQSRLRADETLRLRAEVARLQRELAALQTSRTPVPDGVSDPAKPQGPLKSEARFREARIPLENAPAPVAAAITRELGGAPAQGIVARTKDGLTTYGVKGQLPDGRAVAMQVAEDGSLLERSLQISAAAVPAHIQDPVAQTFGELVISEAREILDGSKLVYELSAKSADARMDIMVRGDGAILGYSAKLKVPEK